MNSKIEQIDGKYRVFFDIPNLNKDCRFFKDFDTLEKATLFEEEFYLNFCLFLMYGTDDEKKLEKYSKKTYDGYKEIFTYQEYKESNIGFLFSRKLVINSDAIIENETYQYKKVENIRDIQFLRNDNIKYKYLQIDKIRDVLRRILLFKGKRQGGFNLTNLYWNAEMSSKIGNYLFPELTKEYTKQDEEAIRIYTGYEYKFYNDLLYGYTIDISKLTKENIDMFFRMLNCFRPTPYDLYLYRGAGADKKYLKNNDEYIYNQFISTSLSSPSTRPFSDEQYQIMIPKGTSVIFAGPTLDSGDSIENEVILLPSKFTIEKEKGGITFLKYKEEINPVELLLDNLIKNKDFYIDKVGEEEYQRIYNYVYKKSLEMKKQELEKIKEDKGKKITSLVEDLPILLNHYGVINQKEDHDIDKYRL